MMKRSLLAVMVIAILGMMTLARADSEISGSMFELYSWQEGNTWNFSVLPASNARKLDTEIKHGGGPLRGLDKMKEKLLSMKEGDRIAWQERSDSGFVYPPNAVIEEISDYAKSIGIKVTVAR